MPAAWDVPTPSGFVYREPTTYDEMINVATTVGQSWVEGWDDAEVPPAPTWRTVDIAWSEARRWKDEAEKLRRQVEYLTSSCSAK